MRPGFYVLCFALFGTSAVQAQAPSVAVTVSLEVRPALAAAPLHLGGAAAEAESRSDVSQRIVFPVRPDWSWSITAVGRDDAGNELPLTWQVQLEEISAAPRSPTASPSAFEPEPWHRLMLDYDLRSGDASGALTAGTVTYLVAPL